MIATGILLGPYALNLLNETVLTISPDLRQIALVIILFRAGLSLDTEDLKAVGLLAFLMSFMPAIFEIGAIVLIAPLLFDISTIDAAVMGAVVAAVSPAVIVPSMLHIMEEGYGNRRRVPQLILAGASLDDIFAIVLFSSFLTLAMGGTLTAASLLAIPLAIVAGLVVGLITGWLLIKLFQAIHLRDSVKIIVLLSVSFLLLELEQQLTGILPLSSLLAIMSMGLAINQFYPVLAQRLSLRYNKLWVAAQILLFVLVGATVDLSYALNAGLPALLLIAAAMIVRMSGVLFSLWPSSLNAKEKLFTTLSYMPKATVQAAIGAVPLAMGLESGSLILTVAVLAILITAPLGSFVIEKTYRKLLEHD